MILFLDQGGQIIKSETTEKIGRNSSDVSMIYIVTKMSRTTQFYLTFRLPNGTNLFGGFADKTEDAEAAIADLVFESVEGWNVFLYKLQENVTYCPGTVEYSVYGVSGEGRKTSCDGSFVIPKGTKIPFKPDELPGRTLDKVLGFIQSFEDEFEVFENKETERNKKEEGRSIAENQRESNEEERKANENQRESNEANRQSILRKGIGEGSVVANDVENNCATKNSFASGDNTFAGLMGYEITTVYPVNDDGVGANILELDSVEGLEEGDVVSYAIFDSEQGGWRPQVDNNEIVHVSNHGRLGGLIMLKKSIRSSELLGADGNMLPKVDADGNRLRLAYFLSVRAKPHLGTHSVSQRAFSMNRDTKATGDGSFSHGRGTKARGDYSTTGGRDTIADAEGSRADGWGAHAKAWYSRASGKFSVTEEGADYSEVSGEGTVATAPCSQVGGKFNIRDDKKEYLEIIGNGTDHSHRSNARTLDNQGNAWYAGDVSVGQNADKLQTENDVHSSLMSGIKFIKKNTVLANVTGNNHDYSSTVLDASWDKYWITDYVPVGLYKNYRVKGLLSYTGANIYPITFHKKDKSFIGAYSPAAPTANTAVEVDLTDELLSRYEDCVYIRLGRDANYDFEYAPINTYRVDQTIERVGRMENLSTEVATNKRDISLLKLANEGHTYAFVTDDTASGFKVIPSSVMPCVVLENIKGRTTDSVPLDPTRWNRLVIRGKNLLNTDSFKLGSIDDKTGELKPASYILRLAEHVPIYDGKSYTASCAKGYDLRHIYFYDADKNFISAVWMSRVQEYTVTAPANAAYFNLCIEPTGIASTTKLTDAEVATIKSECKVQIEYGITATAYAPYIEPKVWDLTDDLIADLLPFFGHGINDYVCNYIDFEKKTYVQMCEHRAKQDGDEDIEGAITSFMYTVAPLAEAKEYDISECIPFDNTFDLQGGGTLEVLSVIKVGENVFKSYVDTPSTIHYQIKL